MDAQTWLRYLRWMLAAFGAAVAMAGAFNVFVDPTGVFGAPRIPGFNAIKPYLDHHRELARWRAAQRLCPSAGIFGNSRAEIGFDPDHPDFRAQGLTAFNHAIPGSGVGVAQRQLGWLRQAGCTPQRVILGVEFFDFLGAGAAGGVPRPVPAPAVDFPFLAETVFSLTGLRDAFATVALQRAPYPATITPQGFNPLLAYIPEVEKNGHYLLFRQRAQENLKNWLKKTPRITPASGGLSVEQAGLEAFLAGAAQSAREVDLVIYPYHAEIRLMMERIGLGALFAEWKRSIFVAADRFAAEHAAEGVAVRVWDFSGIHPYTLEPIPPRGDRRTRLQYYWEAGHFKKALGDHVLSRVLGEGSDFGRQLDAGNLASWLEEDRARVRELLSRPSPLLAEVDDVIGSRPGPGVATMVKSAP
jgi:hypothetical protein